MIMSKLAAGAGAGAPHPTHIHPQQQFRTCQAEGRIIQIC